MVSPHAAADRVYCRPEDHYMAYETKAISLLPTGTNVSRYIHALVEGAGIDTNALQIAEGWRQSPLVAETFRLEQKAAMAPGMTTDATWAAPLVQTGIAAEALTVMRDLSVVAAIEPRCRQVPFRMAVPADTTSVREGSWAAEGVPIPVSAQTFATVPGLDALKAGVIVTMTRELITFGVPSTEAIVRKAAIGGLSALLDFSFLDPASAAAAGRPASITNGATAVTQTGVTAATMGADLAALLAAITTAGSGLTWIMQRKTLANIASALPLNVSGSTLNGLPVITSDTSPKQITLVDASKIVIADEGEFDISTAKNPSLQMDSAPTNPPVAATVYISLYQTNTVGVRIIRTINWVRAVTGAVSYMVTTY
jgi:hypothetical protein